MPADKLLEALRESPGKLRNYRSPDRGETIVRVDRTPNGAPKWRHIPVSKDARGEFVDFSGAKKALAAVTDAAGKEAADRLKDELFTDSEEDRSSFDRFEAEYNRQESEDTDAEESEETDGREKR